MAKFSFVLLYVDTPSASAAFHAGLLDRQPVENSPTFAMLPPHRRRDARLVATRYGLTQSRRTAGDSEIAFIAENAEVLSRVYKDWKGRGVAMAQMPTTMDFGETSVALDPDGHRLRVFVPNDNLSTGSRRPVPVSSTGRAGAARVAAGVRRNPRQPRPLRCA